MICRVESGYRHRYPIRQAACFGVIVLIALAVAAVQGNAEFAAHAAAAGAVTGVVLWVRRTLVIGNAVLWLLAIVGTMHLAGGLVPVPRAWPTTGASVLYNLWLIPPVLRYDHLVHAVGFGTAAVGFWHVLHGLAPTLRPTVGPMLVCWLAAQGCGALNEIAEFIAVLSLDRTFVGGFENAMFDLVSNALGAGAAVVFIAWSSRMPGERLVKEHDVVAKRLERFV